jgi:ATP synthase protein I
VNPAGINSTQIDFTARKIIIAQLLVTLFVALGALMWASYKAAYSASVGGVISAVASLYFAGRVFRHDSSTSPARILRAFYVGEAVKMALTVGLFLVAIVVLKVDILFMLFAYIATLPVYWFALLGPRAGAR